MRKNITFKKMMLLFLGVTLPIFLLGLFLIRQISMAVSNRTFSLIQEKVDMTAGNLEDILEQLYHTAAEVAGQGNLKRLANPVYAMSPYEAAKNVLQMQEQQTSIRNASPYIENFVIYYPNRLQAYNSKESGKASFFEFAMEEYKGLSGTHNSADYLAVHDGKLTEIVKPSFGADFLIRVDLSQEALEEILENIFPEYDSYYLLDAFDHSWQLTNLAEPQEEADGMPGGEPERRARGETEKNAETGDVKTERDNGEEIAGHKVTIVSENGARILVGDEEYEGFSAPFTLGDGRLYFFFSEEELFRDARAYQYLYFYFGLIVFAACSLFLLGSYAIIHRPLRMLVDAFQRIGRQDYSVRITGRQGSDFMYVYQEFNHMAEELGTLIEKNYQQQLLLSRAELKQLQAQINPHFLYNAFFLLRRMIHDELYEEAGQMADTLGLYFQYITRNSQDYMPLGREYHHAMLYCEIQQLRFGDRILIETDPLPEEYGDILVPKLIIQPILENAFNYGLRDKVEDGMLRVTVSREEGCLVIAIEDNGEELTEELLQKIQGNLRDAARGGLLQEMSGMLNIQRRLSVYYGERAGKGSGGGDADLAEGRGTAGAEERGQAAKAGRAGEHGLEAAEAGRAGEGGQEGAGVEQRDSRSMQNEIRKVWGEGAVKEEGTLPVQEEDRMDGGCLKAGRSSLGGLCIRISLPL